MQKNTFSKWLKKAVIIGAALKLIAFSALPAFAFIVSPILANPNLSVIMNGLVQKTDSTKIEITNEKVTFNNGIRINFCMNEDSYITMKVLEAKSETSGTVIAALANKDFAKAGCYSYAWDAKYADGTPAKDNGNYYYQLMVVDSDDSSDTDFATQWITYQSNPGLNPSDDTSNDTSDDSDNISDDTSDDSNSESDSSLISSLKVSPSKISLYDKDEADIKFNLSKKAEVSVKIYNNKSGSLVTKLEDKETLYKGAQKYSWDGTDKNGDYVDEGKYYVKVAAETSTGEKDTEKEYITVQERAGDTTEKARLRDIFVTKDSFDNDRDESVFIVFTTTSESDVTVKLFDGNDLIDVLLEKNDASPGTFSVKWDGKDEDGHDMSYGTYTYKVYVENAKGDDEESGTLKIAEDSEPTKFANIYQDEVTPVFKPTLSNRMSFNFRLSQDANVSIVAYNEGDAIAHVFDGDLNQGDNTIKWDAVDDDGRLLVDGVYDYKITASDYSGDSKEWGKFYISQSFKKDYKQTCAGFRDVFVDNQYCDAIIWANEKGAFDGYDDNTFKPENAIARAEALKVILETLDFDIVDDNGFNLGFSDVQVGAYYMKYLRTAKLYGIVHGYADGTFRPGQQLTKAEAVTMLLNAARAKNSIIIPACNSKPYLDVPLNAWYLDTACYAKYYDLTGDEYYFNAGTLYTRGEMAKLLYNTYTAGLLE